MITEGRTQEQAVYHKPTGLAGAWRAVWRRVPLVLICFFIAVLVTGEAYTGQARVGFVAQKAIGGEAFRLFAWEVQALGQKVEDAVTKPGDELTPDQQHDLVLAYFDAIAEIDRLEGDIESIHADPSIEDSRLAAAPLQAQLDALRAEQGRRRPAVERILQQQVAAVLDEQGLTAAGRVLPPVLFQFTESPDVLIISPRKRIEVEKSTFVDPAVPVATKEEIEAEVEQQLDVSALVEQTGGFSAYPTMVIPGSSLGWVADTIAHEWMHNYLMFHPLGWHYFESGETRTLNETTASIVGGEIGKLVIERYYPELVPTPRPTRPPGEAAGSPAAPAEEAFDFGAFMRETRLHVDKLLAQGRVAEAEGYMEARRRVLVAEGYNIRKLNQAYFAFHGSYAVGPAATDPIGDKLRALRGRSPSLAAFVDVVSGITSVRQLDAVLAATG